MAHSPDREYQASQVFIARNVVKAIREELVVLQEAEFFVDVDTMRDVIDPQGAAACIHSLLEEEIPDELMKDPNVVGLIDEFDWIAAKPQAKLAVKTLFQDGKFRNIVKDAVQELQSRFGETAGESPTVLQRYFDGEVLF